MALPFVLVTREAFAEYHGKRAEIDDLARRGAHEMDIAYQRRALRRWAREQIAAMRGGNWLVPCE